MSQSRLRNYKHPILSFEHNLYNLGMHNPGRYCGFDTLVATDVLLFKLTHAQTGIEYKDPNNSVLGPIGILLTAQGTLLMEDDEVLSAGFAIDTNAGNGETRYDLIVLTHSQIQNTGGQDGIYSVIKGPISSPVFPLLADPLKQIIIGILEIPAGATDIADAIYTKAKCPDSGDGEDARLYENNIFRGLQGFNASNRTYTDWTIESDDVLSAVSVHSSLWELDGDANTFKLMPAGPTNIDGIKLKNVPLQDGTMIKLIINSNPAVRANRAWVPTQGSKGYRPFEFPPLMGNFYDPTAPGQNDNAIRPPTGKEWILHCIYVGDAWRVYSVTGENQEGEYVSWGALPSTVLSYSGGGTTIIPTVGGQLAWVKRGNICTIDMTKVFVVVAPAIAGSQFLFALGTSGVPAAKTGSAQHSSGGFFMKIGSYTFGAMCQVNPLTQLLSMYTCGLPEAGDHIMGAQISYECDY